MYGDGLNQVYSYNLKLKPVYLNEESLSLLSEIVQTNGLETLFDSGKLLEICMKPN